MKKRHEILFLDGVHDVSLFEGSFGAGPNPNDFVSLTSTMVIKDRLKTAKLLICISNDEIERRSSKYFPTDLPMGIGPRVGVFVGRARFMTQLCAARHSSQVTRCNLCTCRHKFICVSQQQQQSQRFSISIGDEDDDDDDEYDDDDAKYWKMLSPRPIHTLQNQSFCSKSCSIKYEKEVEQAVPVDLFSVEKHEMGISKKTGVSRLLAATRASFRRNDAAARALRDSMRSLRKLESRTVSLTDIAKIHQNIIDVFNIDLALQYAAASLSDTSIRFLPGKSANWRSNNTKQQTRSIERIKSIYLKHYKTSDAIARDERFPPKWLQRVKEQASSIFPA